MDCGRICRGRDRRRFRDLEVPRHTSSPVESVSQLISNSEAKPFHWLQTLETDGTRVYFNGGIFGNLKVVEVGVAGGQTAQIPTSLVSPPINALAPDDSSLLVLTMLPPGQPSRREAPCGRSLFPPARLIPCLISTGATITPDNHLLYSLGSSLYLAEHDGFNPRKLVEIPESYYGRDIPSVSPDGKRVSFSAYRGYNGTDIWEMGIDGTNPHQLLVGGKSDIPKFLGSPKWTPDCPTPSTRRRLRPP